MLIYCDFFTLYIVGVVLKPVSVCLSMPYSTPHCCLFLFVGVFVWYSRPRKSMCHDPWNIDFLRITTEKKGKTKLCKTTTTVNKIISVRWSLDETFIAIFQYFYIKTKIMPLRTYLTTRYMNILTYKYTHRTHIIHNARASVWVYYIFSTLFVIEIIIISSCRPCIMHYSRMFTI